MRTVPVVLAIFAFAVLASACATTPGEQNVHADYPVQPLSKNDTRDRAGLRRDTLYFLGFQWAAIAVLYASPESVSGWTDEQKEGYDMSIWWDNVTDPQIDSDDFYINYLLHPYWGASYFVRAKERGYSDTEAFWYSALLSTAYEFGAEALFEEPSIQDIFVTPIFGSLLGQYFVHVRSGIRDRERELGYRKTGDKWLWVITDPLGALNRGIDKLVGREDALQMRPYSYVSPWQDTRPFGPPSHDAEVVYGIEIRFEW